MGLSYDNCTLFDACLPVNILFSCNSPVFPSLLLFFRWFLSVPSCSNQFRAYFASMWVVWRARSYAQSMPTLYRITLSHSRVLFTSVMSRCRSFRQLALADIRIATSHPNLGVCTEIYAFLPQIYPCFADVFKYHYFYFNVFFPLSISTGLYSIPILYALLP